MNLECSISELTYNDLEMDLEGFLLSLSNLTQIGEISINDAKIILSKINNQNGRVYIAKNDREIIGTTTLLVEQKFTHQGGKVGHIEDVSVREEYEGNGIGSSLMKKAINEAKRFGCYKLILDCSDENIPFYERLGFYKKENEMRMDLD